MRRIWLSAGFVAIIVLIALCAPLLPLPDPVRQDIPRRLSGPMPGAWLGRDEFGRDVLSRLIWGARTSLFVAFSSTLIACVVGVTLGLISGWGKSVAAVISLRSMDIVLCFPPILLAILAVTLLGPGSATLILVLCVLYLPSFVRVTHTQVISLKRRDFVEATRAMGAAGRYVLLRTVLPNIAGPIFIQFSLAMAAAVVLESGLSLLGLGVVPPAPSWGLMIRGARATMEQAPLLMVWPCAALTLTILAINQLCDAMRDFFDPTT